MALPLSHGKGSHRIFLEVDPDIIICSLFEGGKLRHLFPLSVAFLNQNLKHHSRCFHLLSLVVDTLIIRKLKE